MVNRKTKDMWSPYGGLVTKILEHAGLNFESEVANQKYTRVRSDTLNEMGIDIKVGVISYRTIEIEKNLL